ncbi:MAG: formyltransferase family protein [Acidimicrobiia bacterium]
MNIAFYVSGKAGRLKKILEHGSEELIKSTKLIFSDDRQNSFLEKPALGLAIEYHCLDYQAIRRTDRSRNLILSDELLELLRRHSVEYCFSFGDHLLKGEILNEYKYRLINFHPSILPMFPGRLSVDQAVDAGSNLLGNTAHFIGPGVDDGPIIMQHVVSAKVFEGDYDSILDQQVVMLEQIFAWLRSGRLSVNDDEVTVFGANYQGSAFFPELETEE